MMSTLSILVLVATLGQVPAESDWLNAVPLDADVVFRVRGLGIVKNDLVAMIKAMSPTLAGRAEPALEQGVALAQAQASEQVDRESFLIMLRGVPPQEPNSLPFAFIIKSANYEADLRLIAAGKDPEVQHLSAGYDSFHGPGGRTWYASRGTGSLAFGADRILIEGFSKAGDKALGKTITPGLLAKFLAGDIGMYVNNSALATRYAEPIAQAEQTLFATFEKLGPQMGTGMVGLFKSLYGALFDSIKEADALALSLEFGAEGLGTTGTLTVKADSKAIKTIANIRTGDAVELTRLPAESSYYVYMNMSSEIFGVLQKMSLQMLSPDKKASADLDAAIAKEQGRIETVSSMSIGSGIKSFQVTTLADPRSFGAAYELMIKLMQAADSPMKVFKETESTPNAEKYRGFTFARIAMTLDYDKLGKLQPTNPSAASIARTMYGGDTITSWLGIGKTQLIQVIAPSWLDARSQIDGYFRGETGIGSSAGFQATRARLPKEASVLALMSAQGLVRQVTAQLALMAPQAARSSPGERPEKPSLIGFSLTPAPPRAFDLGATRRPL